MALNPVGPDATLFRSLRAMCGAVSIQGTDVYTV